MIIVDTGVLYAAADRDDADHAISSRVLLDHLGALAVPVPVVVESSWLIESRLGPAAEAAFLRSVASGELTRLDLTTEDWTRTAELVDRYADLGLGLVDASVVAIAERLGVEELATLNQRDFRVVRPRHCPAFHILP
jgi:predicted nucleic acid-binding protein